MERKSHVLVTACPGQGHVAPLMKLAHKIAEYGIKVTFVNTHSIHDKIMAAMSSSDVEQCLLRLVSIPDGLESDEERKDRIKRTNSLFRVVPVHLRNLIKEINESTDDEKITCVIADSSAIWAFEVAKEMGIKRAAVAPFALECLALMIQVPKLIKDGVLDEDGFLLKDEQICLSKRIAPWRNNEFSWTCPGKLEDQKMVYRSFVCKAYETVELSDWFLVNSFYELEPSACQLLPNILPIGPLRAINTRSRHPVGSFWHEDLTCLSWLDKQSAGSVIYVAFGSSALFSQKQLHELAFGLELTGRPFLWVARSDLMNGTSPEFPDGFMERIKGRGNIVSWASQENVLSHPSIACFISHCGWNSTIEGLSNGVPFLCWPCCFDQFHNMRSICETWEIGIGLTSDEEGIVSRQEVAAKVAMLLADEVIKSNALKLKELAINSISEGGSSFRNFERFIEQIAN